MAYSKTPTNDTYSTQRISLTREINARDGGQTGKDEDFVNVFIEPVRARQADDRREFIVKRAGTQIQIASVSPTEIRGVIFWKDQSKFFYCVGTDIIVYNVNTGVSTTITPVFGTSSGVVGFTEYLYDNNDVVIIATDGVTLVQIDTSNVLTTCSDVDLPTPHLPYPVFLDGFLFLVKQDTADIYNSKLNDPMTWTAGDFIASEMEGDYVVRIAKLNNYLVAFGSETIEYFWDAGIATGSPLQRNETPIKMNTYLGGFAQYENAVYFIGAGAGGQPDVYVLKDFKIENVGSPTVSRYLSHVNTNPNTWQGNIVSASGHTFFVLNAGNSMTWVYDVDFKLWAKWKFQNTNTFPIINTALVKTTTGIKTYFVLSGANSAIYRFNEDLYQDVGVNFVCQIITEANDFGSLNRKFMYRLSVVADRPPADSYLSISWSDDDYQTFSSVVNVNLNQDLSSTNRLGWFRQRVFKLVFTDNYMFRIQELEADINKGNS